MFTGIIEDLGTIRRIQAGAQGGKTLVIETKLDPQSIAIGDSVATSGVCLTATSVDAGCFGADAGPETLSRTTIGRLKVGDQVNLERSVTPSTRLGGHLVSGHVDAVGRIQSVQKRQNAVDFWISVPAEVLRLVIPRGSVTVSGISLTVTDRRSDAFALSLIPHTVAVTTVPQWKTGTEVNVEVDVIARYVDALLPGGNQSSGGLSFERLAALGFGGSAK